MPADRRGVAVVTGGGRGIGAACAERLAAEGWRVAICARRLADVRRTARGIARRGGVAVAARCDVSREADVRRFFALVRRRLGPVEVLVNNAGIWHEAPLVRHRTADWDRVVAINLRGAFLCLREALRDMIRRRRGSVVNVASILGRRGAPEVGAYCASKFGLIGLTLAAAEETRGTGVRVNAVCPGAVDTSLFGRFDTGWSRRGWLSADEVARTCLWLVSPQASGVHGAAVDVHGRRPMG